jgi:peroxiredoxin
MTDAGPTPVMGAEVFSSKRIVLVDDGVVKELNVLNPGEHKVSDAEFTVCQL